MRVLLTPQDILKVFEDYEYDEHCGNCYDVHNQDAHGHYDSCEFADNRDALIRLATLIVEFASSPSTLRKGPKPWHR